MIASKVSGKLVRRRFTAGETVGDGGHAMARRPAGSRDGQSRAGCWVEPGLLFLLGFGLFLAWGTCASQAKLLLTGDAGPTRMLALMHAITLFSLAVFANARKVTLYSRHALLVFGCLALASPLVGMGMSALMHGGMTLGVASAACEGAGRAGLHLLWAERLACFERRVAWPAYAAAFVVAPLAYCLVAFVPDAAAIAIAPLLLIVSCLFLWLSACLVGRGGERGRAPAQGSERGASINEWHIPWRASILVAVFSFAHYMSRCFSGGSTVLGQMGCLLVGLSLFVACTTLIGRLDLCAIYRLCPPIMVCALLLHLQRAYLPAPFGCVLSYAGFVGAMLFVLLGLNCISFQTGTRAAWLFGVVEGFQALAHFAGTQVGMWLVGTRDAGVSARFGLDATLVTCVVYGTVVVLVLLCMALPSNRGVMSSWGVDLANDERTMRRRRPSGLIRGVPLVIGGRFEGLVWRCGSVARYYGLTPREEEILTLTALDKTPQEIGDMLYISRNTVRGHLQHVYAKLNVHSREEAIEIVAQWKQRQDGARILG